MKAPVPPKPDLMEQMKSMAASHGSHGTISSHSNPINNKDSKPMDHSHHHKKQNDLPEHHQHSLSHQKAPHKPKEHQTSSSEYNDLKAFKKTKFSKTLPVRTIHLNLTGNMRRYVWSMNGKILSESDKIKINQNEVVRLMLHNTTMMHHPMHLHGHFFRVLNKQGDYAPLKHTVDVPPMETVTLEFLPKEEGIGFFTVMFFTT